MELIDAIKESYREVFPGNEVVEITGEDIFLVKFNKSGHDLFYNIIQRGDELVTNEISIMLNADENLFYDVVDMNKKIGKKLRCSKLITEALYGVDKKWLQNKGFVFGEDSYVGGYNLK